MRVRLFTGKLKEHYTDRDYIDVELDGDNKKVAFYVHKAWPWKVTPRESRYECLVDAVMRIYDTHIRDKDAVENIVEFLGESRWNKDGNATPQAWGIYECEDCGEWFAGEPDDREFKPDDRTLCPDCADPLYGSDLNNMLIEWDEDLDYYDDYDR